MIWKKLCGMNNGQRKGSEAHSKERRERTQKIGKSDYSDFFSKMWLKVTFSSKGNKKVTWQKVTGSPENKVWHTNTCIIDYWTTWTWDRFGSPFTITGSITCTCNKESSRDAYFYELGTFRDTRNNPSANVATLLSPGTRKATLFFTTSSSRPISGRKLE